MRSNPGKFTCKECTERYPACHDKCEKFQAERKAWDEMQKRIRSARDMEQSAMKASIDGMKRMKNKRGVYGSKYKNV